jgi:AraC family transcriptional regulator
MIEAPESEKWRRFEDYAVRDPLASTLPTAIERFHVENNLRFSRGWLQVRDYTWTQPVEDVWIHRPDIYLFDLALSPRPAQARIAHLGVGQESAPREMGRVLMIPPGSTIRSGSSAGRQRALHCLLDRHVVEDILPQQPDWDARTLRDALRLDGREFEWLLLKMYRELREERFASELMLEAFAGALAVELARCFQFRPPAADLRKGGLAPWRMRLVRERAYADAPAPSLTELAASCGLTIRQLCRAFKAETGQTVGKFVETATAERASALLADGGLSVGEAARRLGFANAASFAVAFHRATGLRPSEVAGPRRGARAGAKGG